MNLGSDVSFRLRLILSSIFYLCFVILFYLIGLYQSFLLSLILSFPTSLYFQIKNQSMKNIDISRIKLSFGYSLYLVIILLLFPIKLSILNVIFTMAMFEEIFFRFCLLGIFKYELDFEDNKWKTVLLIIINSIFFLALHKQYTDFFDLLVVFLLGIYYALSYITLGILPAFIAHIFWNLYSPNLLFQIPIILGILLSILIPRYLSDRTDRKNRIPFLQ